MHPILARKGRLVPYLAASAPLAAVLVVLLARPGALSLGEAAALSVPMTVLFAFLGLSAFYPAKSSPPGKGKIGRLIATHMLASAVTSAVWVFAGAGLARLLALAPAFDGLAERYAREVPLLFGAGVLMYLLSVALHYVLIEFETVR